LLAHAKSWRPYSNDPRQAVRDGCLALWDFIIHNPAASQLLFERTIPGFEPSPSSYALAQEFLSFNTELLVAAGVNNPADVDIFTALEGGLFAQQDATSREKRPSGPLHVQPAGATNSPKLNQTDRSQCDAQPQ